MSGLKACCEEHILEKRMIWERGRREEVEKREKSIQVFLITSAEKTANEKKNEGKKIKDRKKNPLQGRFFWFCIFQIIILWSASGCARECFNAQEFSIISSAFK